MLPPSLRYAITVL